MEEATNHLLCHYPLFDSDKKALAHASATGQLAAFCAGAAIMSTSVSSPQVSESTFVFLENDKVVRKRVVSFDLPA